jgi:hypothetical protein
MNLCKQHTCTTPEIDEKFQQTAKEKGYQECKICGHVIELKEACNHITCECGHEFCYLCGEEWYVSLCPKGCPKYGQPQYDDEGYNQDGFHRETGRDRQGRTPEETFEDVGPEDGEEDEDDGERSDDEDDDGDIPPALLEHLDAGTLAFILALDPEERMVALAQARFHDGVPEAPDVEDNEDAPVEEDVEDAPVEEDVAYEQESENENDGDGDNDGENYEDNDDEDYGDNGGDSNGERELEMTSEGHDDELPDVQGVHVSAFSAVDSQASPFTPGVIQAGIVPHDVVQAGIYSHNAPGIGQDGATLNPGIVQVGTFATGELPSTLNVPVSTTDNSNNGVVHAQQGVQSGAADHNNAYGSPLYQRDADDDVVMTDAESMDW